MSLDIYVKGRNNATDKGKKEALATIKYLKSLDLAIPHELWAIAEDEDETLKFTKGPRDGYYEYVVKVKDIPKNVDEVVFQISR